MARFSSTFIRNDYFPAIVRLLAAQEQSQLSEHAEEAELLLGGMYLSYGHHLEAADIFERLLADKVAPEIRDRTWFFLAKIWKQRGYLDKSQEALTKLSDTCPKICGVKRRCCRHRSISTADSTIVPSHCCRLGRQNRVGELRQVQSGRGLGSQRTG